MQCDFIGLQFSDIDPKRASTLSYIDRLHAPCQEKFVDWSLVPEVESKNDVVTVVNSEERLLRICSILARWQNAPEDDERDSVSVDGRKVIKLINAKRIHHQHSSTPSNSSVILCSIDRDGSLTGVVVVDREPFKRKKNWYTRVIAEIFSQNGPQGIFGCMAKITKDSSSKGAIWSESSGARVNVKNDLSFGFKEEGNLPHEWPVA